MSRPVSAGLLVWRRRAGEAEFLLVHPGGPYWARRDSAAWSFPKGVVEAGEATKAAALREFAEELGQSIEARLAGEPQPLTPHRMPGGKLVVAWLVEADLELGEIRSNLFELEWPPRSGRRTVFPEVDRAEYFPAPLAMVKIHIGLKPVLEEAIARLASASDS